ncbi:MAG TPA: ABC-2 transporter permease [Bacillota bacterium]|nr:ABC-2 transporter permease [Bacillota bacterium]
MHNLILKDFMLQKKLMLFGFVYILFMVFALQKIGDSMFAMCVFALSYMMILTSCAYDDKNKTDVMLNSLPLSRTEIVLARYLSAAVFFAVTVVVYMAVVFLLNVAGTPFKDFSPTAESFTGAVLTVSLLTGIYFPLYFKMGYIKSRYVNFVLFFGFFFGISALGDMLREGNTVLSSLNNFLGNFTDARITACSLIFSVLYLAASFALSLKFYRGREF